MNIDLIVCFLLGNYPKESIQHIEHGESLKSRIDLVLFHPDRDIVLVWRCFKIGHPKKNLIVPSGP